ATTASSHQRRTYPRNKRKPPGEVDIVDDIIIIQEKIFNSTSIFIQEHWFHENEKTNYHCPMMFLDNDGHIVMYLQIKITKDNIM
ncbi:14312_t:CDS:2, partial [Gigaspora rosea]